jgi:hypothetical protein
LAGFGGLPLGREDVYVSMLAAKPPALIHKLIHKHLLF